MAVRSRRRGQVLVIAALAIALSILAVQVYLYDLSETSISSNFDSLSDYILGIEQGSSHVVETSLEDSGGWLQGWGRRVRLNIDSNDIDENLTDFPVLIYLSSSSGRNDDNLSFVFDEIQSESDRKKIALTTSDGETQCYAEIERWNATSEEAWLWVRVPSISDSSNTELYLYYDSDHADNTVYVGDPNSAPAEAVWGNDFRLVTHMRDDPDTSHVRDSTGYDNDGTKTAAGEPVVTTSGNISDAQVFDGSDDYVDLGSDTSLDLRTTDFTVEAWIYPTTQTVIWPTFYVIGVWELSFGIGQDNNTDKLEAVVDDSVSYASDSNVTYNEWNYVVLSWNGSHYNFYIDGETDGSRSGSSYPDTGTTYIGGTPPFENKGCFNGTIDEVRTSNTSRSTPWIKASYESGIESLVDYEEEETVEAYYRGEAVANLVSYLVRWESFVGGDYAYGLCYLNSTPATQSPYSEGIWIDWGVDGVGITGACSDYTFNVSGRGAEADLSFIVNRTTRIQASGGFQDMGGDSKAVTVTMQLTKDGSPALHRDVTPEVMTSTGWTDMTALDDYAEKDHGNGTYTYTFTADISGSDVPVRLMVHDRRGIYVMAEVTLSEG
jgi:hypothetical protein